MIMNNDFNFMISKKARIAKKDIPNIVRRGKRFSGKGFDIKVWFDNTLESPKFTIIVSKKVDKSAVKRNLIKRKFRAAIFEILKENSLQIFKNANYIIIIRSPEVAELKSTEISALLKESLTNKG